jgi:hypothetical protein
MKVLKKARKAFRDFNYQCENQKIGALRFLDIQNVFEVDLDQPREIDFFFYSKKRKNASNLQSILENKGYNVERIYQLNDNEYSICGTAPIASLGEEEFLVWVEAMNEIAFVSNCKFDGWGMISRLDN